jgi:phage terminase large subunit GpA-like protein
MPAIASLAVTCTQCGKEFPPNFFTTDTRALTAMLAAAPQAICPHCKHSMKCTDQSVRFVLEDPASTKSFPYLS